MKLWMLIYVLVCFSAPIETHNSFVCFTKFLGVKYMLKEEYDALLGN